MKNIDNITYKIKFKNIFNICKELDVIQYNENSFTCYFIEEHNCIINFLYLGTYNNYYIFLPIETTDIYSFSLFNKNFNYIDNYICQFKNLYFIDFSLIISKTFDNCIYKNVDDINDIINNPELISLLQDNKFKQKLSKLNFYIKKIYKC